MDEEKTKRKPGRVPGPEMRLTSVYIPPHLLEWAKAQTDQGGLSGLVRECLESKYRARETENA